MPQSLGMACAGSSVDKPGEGLDTFYTAQLFYLLFFIFFCCFWFGFFL